MGRRVACPLARPLSPARMATPPEATSWLQPGLVRSSKPWTTPPRHRTMIIEAWGPSRETTGYELFERDNRSRARQKTTGYEPFERDNRS